MQAGDSSVAILKRVPLFAELDENELERLAALVVFRDYPKSAFIFMEGDPGEALFFIKRGKVKIYKTTPDGREQILHFLKEGDIFAEVVLFDGGPYPATAEVMEASTIGMLRNADVEDLIRREPGIAIKILHVMSRRLREAQAHIRDIALRDMYGRVASVLYRLCQEHGTPCREGVRIDLGISRQELAGMVGTTRETVTRILSEFKRMGILHLERRGIIIRDEKKLKGLL